jgi:uncharacterized membrane protein YkoI
MACQRFTFIAFIAASAATPALAVESSDLIPVNQAVGVAQLQVPGFDTPIKIELETNEGPLHYEVKTFTNASTLWEVKVNPVTGVAFDVDSSNGGGAQDDIAEAQDVIAVSSFTLYEAMSHIQTQFPEYFLIEIEMQVRDGLPIFDAEMVRGAYKLELRMRASDGLFIKQSLHLMATGNELRNIHIPDVIPGDSPLPSDVSGFLNARQIIVAAQTQFAGSEAYDVELDETSSATFRYEVRLLQGNSVIKAKFHPVTGILMSSQPISDAQLVNRVQSALDNAQLTLLQAINTAKIAAPGKFVEEAELRLQNDGHLFNVEFLTNAGAIEVKVNAVSGAITSVEFED